MNPQLEPATGALVTIEPATRPASQNPALVYLAGLTSPKSRTSMRSHLDRIAGLLSNGEHDIEGKPFDCRTLRWDQLRYQHVAALRSVLAERYAPATANAALCALRGTLKECWRLGQMTPEDLAKAIDVKGIKGERLPKGRALARQELATLQDLCRADSTHAGRRDAALLAILFVGGLRRNEASGLDVSDFDPAEGSLRVRHGKGRKERIVYLNAGAIALLEGWLNVSLEAGNRDKSAGDVSAPLFRPVSKAGRVLDRRLSGQAIYGIVGKRAGAAGLASCAPHDFRRTFVSTLLDKGVDLSTVQKMAGHASVQTTARYDRRGEAAKRKAAQLLDL